jgi:hypothetical protein
MTFHRRTLLSPRPAESTNDPPCSESSANRESEGGLRSALVGRAHRDKAGPITRTRIIILGVSVHPRFGPRWKSFATNIDRIGRAHLQRKIPKRG